MKVNFDKKSDIIRIKFQEGEYEISQEIAGGIILDITKDNKIMAIEIMDVSQKVPRKSFNDISVDLVE